MSERFDLVVVGAGPGGYVAAIRAAQLGLHVALVDKNKALGGTCLNIGCIPSKALLDSSELYYLAKNRFTHHGIDVGPVQLDLPRLLARKNDIVKNLTEGVAFLMRKNRIAVFHGAGRLADRGRVEISGENKAELHAPAILLATGSEPTPLPFMPFDGAGIVSSTEALSFPAPPDHLLIIGGGYIGLELGSVWSRLGSRVTVLEFLPRLLPLNDGEVAGLLHKSLVRQGLEFHLKTKVTGAASESGRVTIEAEMTGKRLTFQGDKVLVAVGRRPRIQGLGLEEAGVVLEKKTGKVQVNAKYETSVAGVYAIGDLIAGPMLAHKASEEGVAFAENLAGKAGHVNYAALPSVIYTNPELASVGLTEEQVKDSGRAYKVGRFPFQANGRAKCLDETEGLVKVITDARTDRLLGMHILGPRASDLIAEAVLALEFSASAEDIARTCHGHPSLSEAVGEAARAAWSKALHA